MLRTVSRLRDQWAKGIKYEMAVRCEACTDALHIIPKKDFKPHTQKTYCKHGRKFALLPDWIPIDGGKLHKK